MWHCNTQVLYMFMILKIAFCCDCNKKHSQNDTESDKPTIDKTPTEDNNTLTTPYENIYTKEEKELKEYEVLETRFKINQHDTDEGQENRDVICPALKKGITHNLDRIADVWQTIYYRTTEMLSCFKIFIRKTTVDEREYYAQTYGDFNGNISWNDCLLEIQSSDKLYSKGRKHFLQGSMGKGVFENMIILEGKSKHATLSVEGPDQWAVFNNILMMRDCADGDIIVFARVPHEPRLDTVLHSLKMFGEESPNGVESCVDNGRVGRSIMIVPKEILRKYFRNAYGYS